MDREHPNLDRGEYLMAMNWEKGCAWRSGCSKVVPLKQRYCEEHEKIRARERTKANREKNPLEQAFYNSKEWRWLSRNIRSTQQFCEGCKRQGLAKFGDLVDHIVPLKLAWPLRLEPSNLQVLCHQCHNKKRDLEGRFYMKKPEIQNVVVVIAPDVNERINAVKRTIPITLDFAYEDIITIDSFDIYQSIVLDKSAEIQKNLLIACDKIASSLYVNMAMNAGILSSNKQLIIGTSANTESKLLIFKTLFPNAIYFMLFPDMQFCEKNNVAKEWQENCQINLEEHEEIEVLTLSSEPNIDVKHP